jgi:hypothetical protein
LKLAQRTLRALIHKAGPLSDSISFIEILFSELSEDSRARRARAREQDVKICGRVA